MAAPAPRAAPAAPPRPAAPAGSRADAVSPQVYYYAAAQTTHTTYPQGLEVLHFSSGQTGGRPLRPLVVQPLPHTQH